MRAIPSSPSAPGALPCTRAICVPPRPTIQTSHAGHAVAARIPIPLRSGQRLTSPPRAELQEPRPCQPKPQLVPRELRPVLSFVCDGWHDERCSPSQCKPVHYRASGEPMRGRVPAAYGGPVVPPGDVLSGVCCECRLVRKQWSGDEQLWICGPF